jgi:hypothetical protein
MSTLLAQALSPSLGAILIEGSGAGAVLGLPQHRTRGRAVVDRAAVGVDLML